MNICNGLKRPTSIFTILTLCMCGFGLIIGVIFPFAILLMGFSPEKTLTIHFFIITISSGLIVALFNVAISRAVVVSKLEQVSTNMEDVRKDLWSSAMDRQNINCIALKESQMSPDAVGNICKSYNLLWNTLSSIQKLQRNVSNYNRTLAKTLDIEELCLSVLHFMLDNTKATAGMILQKHEARGISVLAQLNFEISDAFIEGQRLNDLFDSDLITSIDVPEGVVVDRIVSSSSPNCVLLIPVVLDGKSRGMIIYASDEPFDRADTLLMQMTQDSSGVALRNVLVHEELKRVAAIDTLTQLPNRRFGLQRMKEEMSRAYRNQSFLSIAMLDIDFFKKINDIYGHLAGDAVLVSIGVILKREVRVEDVVLRYGGEEFLMGFPHANSVDEALIVCERIRIAIENHKFVYKNEVIDVHVSIGISTYQVDISDPSATLKSFIDLADNALYYCKSNGRNCVKHEGTVATEEELFLAC